MTRMTLIVLAALVATSVCIASSDVTLIANGRQITSDPPPMIQDGRTYVPLRAAAEAVGGKVEYDPQTKRITICRGVLCTLIRQSDGITVAGRVLVGIRQVGEALNAEVNWDADTRTVRITTTD